MSIEILLWILLLPAVASIDLLVNASIRGGIAGGTETRAYILKNKKKMWINSIASNIICIYNDSIPGSEFIAKSGGLLWKWYIYGKGIIPRWSKTHRLLNKLYKELPDREQHIREYQSKN